MKDSFINELYDKLKKRQKADVKDSYTSQLIKDPDLLAKKLGEETSELIIDFIKRNKSGVVKESADLLYHLLVIWLSMGVNPKDIWTELNERRSLSGVEEKKRRKYMNE